ncbi:hypothetical protein PG997_005655 [Apiospora hydei]|uniref:Uncharacterized protein n=1 Tax=Apiospora hydei TaxID=1337664 RepID=A0ABR1WLH6_9PEZI
MAKEKESKGQSPNDATGDSVAKRLAEVAPPMIRGRRGVWAGRLRDNTTPSAFAIAKGKKNKCKRSLLPTLTNKRKNRRQFANTTGTQNKLLLEAMERLTLVTGDGDEARKNDSGKDEFRKDGARKDNAKKDNDEEDDAMKFEAMDIDV